MGSIPASPAKYQRLRFGNINYLKECYVELVKKTTWPTWQKLQSSALLVMVATVILALMLFIIDFAFQHLMTFIYTL